MRQQAMLCIVALRLLPHGPSPSLWDSDPESMWVGRTGKVWELDWMIQVAKSVAATSSAYILGPGEETLGNMLGPQV